LVVSNLFDLPIAPRPVDGVTNVKIEVRTNVPCAFHVAGPDRRGLVGGFGWARPRAPVSLSVCSKMQPVDESEAQRSPFQERPQLGRGGPGLIVRLGEELRSAFSATLISGPAGS
jgi:hypothetical protein